HVAARPRRHRRRRADADGQPVPRTAVRRRLRRGLRPLPDLASPDDKEAPAVTFGYEMARFISFRDHEACERVRRIRRDELTNHPNPEFRIAIVDEARAFYQAFADDLVARIRSAREEGRPFVAILPVGPMPQYELAARAINEERLSLAHVHTFNVDADANEDGVTAHASRAGSFQRASLARF